ncbi:ribokinase [Rhodococcus erythropolis]|uniref:ribokinase n=1 Tax=Rhodococcus erythropolis TaxID=1833 RepID=UPI0008782747|nr:ribokinase [Rhodococcus erythropolis]OFV73843.1 ribokinase [Rhodococcus erythropolis]
MRDSASSSDQHGIGVVVFGSINADTSVFVESLPAPGETVHAKRLHRDSGGKGANQACAAAFTGAATTMVGNVGDDTDGIQSRAALRDAGVDDTGVLVVDVPTGTALITVDLQEAENTIVVAAGANALMTEERAVAVAGAAVVVLQLEVPIGAVLAAARASTGQTILNAAPAAELPAALLDAIDILVVNETELDVISRPFVSGGTAVEKARSITGPPIVVVTLGADGALVVQGDSHTAVPAPRVVPVDTTGAGDCFVGALAAHLVAGIDIDESVRRAVAAASRTTLFDGARGYLSAGTDD